MGIRMVPVVRSGTNRGASYDIVGDGGTVIGRGEIIDLPDGRRTWEVYDVKGEKVAEGIVSADDERSNEEVIGAGCKGLKF